MTVGHFQHDLPGWVAPAGATCCTLAWNRGLKLTRDLLTVVIGSAEGLLDWTVQRQNGGKTGGEIG